jgi:hypothetical protein
MGSTSALAAQTADDDLMKSAVDEQMLREGGLWLLRRIYNG